LVEANFGSFGESESVTCIEHIVDINHPSVYFL